MDIDEQAELIVDRLMLEAQDLGMLKVLRGIVELREVRKHWIEIVGDILEETL